MNKLTSFALKLFLCLSIAVANDAVTQDKVLDSLYTYLENNEAKRDSNVFLTQIDISKIIRQQDMEKSRQLAFDALELAEELAVEKYIFIARNEIAITYGMVGENIKALEYFLLCFDADTSKFSDKNKGNMFNNLGIVSLNLGQFEESIAYHIEGLKYRDRAGDNYGVASSYNNIALVYYRQKLWDEALEHYNHALDLLDEVSAKTADLTINIYNNSGLVLENQEKYAEALERFYQAEAISKEFKKDFSLGHCYQNIGKIHLLKKEYTTSKQFFGKALEISKNVGDEYGANLVKQNLATIEFNQGNFAKGLEIVDGLEEYYERIGDLVQLQELYMSISKAHYDLGKFKEAFDYQNKMVSVKDSIFVQEGEKAIAEMEAKYESDKQKAISAKQKAEIQLLEQQKEMDQLEIAKKNAESDRQKNFINFVVTILVVALLLVGVIAYGFIQKRKDNKVISQQKEEVEHQKTIVEEKNKEIMDSITYAKRIQDAILPADGYFKQLLPTSFVLYKPKDIVAGDFYWIEVVDNTIIYASADCTGHGVPGAMVSVVCHNALNRAVREFGITEPGQILDKVTELVVETFEQRGDIDRESDIVKDGMDISLCAINTTTNEMKFSGANNPLYLVRNGELMETKGNRQPIGQYSNRVPFTTHLVQLQSNDILYTFTDGLADQFGGPRGKKFKYKSFKELLVNINDKTMEEQLTAIDEAFTQWKGEFEQIDDVCVIGVKI